MTYSGDWDYPFYYNGFVGITSEPLPLYIDFWAAVNELNSIDGDYPSGLYYPHYVDVNTDIVFNMSLYDQWWDALDNIPVS